MAGKLDNEWQKLCQEIVRESDPHKVAELVQQLNQALDESAAKPGRVDGSAAGKQGTANAQEQAPTLDPQPRAC